MLDLTRIVAITFERCKVSPKSNHRAIKVYKTNVRTVHFDIQNCTEVIAHHHVPTALPLREESLVSVELEVRGPQVRSDCGG
jgi:hypothetical protein